MFVRAKKIKGNTYAYLVKNEWTPWGSRQRVSKYLGKTIKLQKIKEEQKELPKGIQQAIIEATAQELENHGFTRQESILTKEDITINLQEQKIRQKNKKIVLEMNEGYLCDHTIKELLSFTPEERPDKNAEKLAMLVLEAGLKPNTEQFTHLFEQTEE